MEQTTKQLVEQSNKKGRRSGKGRVIAQSRKVYRLVNTDVFYVESESSNNDTYYFVKFKPDVLEWCSCLDNSIKGGQKCKHIWSIEFAIRMGTIKDTDRLPTEAKVRKVVSATTLTVVPTKSSYKDDDYSFWLIHFCQKGDYNKLMLEEISSNNNYNTNKKLFTIQYTKEELDKITLDFVTQMNNYIARVNDRIIKTLEEIEKEETVTTVVVTGKSSYKDYDYSFWPDNREWEWGRLKK